jgi:hypothetical protein
MTHPEFRADDPPALIADAVHRFGCALVRGLFPPALAARWRERATRNFALLDLLKPDSQASDLDVGFLDESPREVEVEGRGIKTPVAIWSAIDAGFYAQNPGFFQHSVLHQVAASALVPVLRAVFDGPIAFSHDASRVRRHAPAIAHQRLHLHQDAASADYGDRLVVTCWTPFMDCGEDAPGLQVYPRRLDTLLPTKRAKWHAREDALQPFKADMWKPVFAAGDALLFTATTLHGTHLTDDMHAWRYSLDVRAHRPGLGPRFMDGQRDFPLSDGR